MVLIVRPGNFHWRPNYLPGPLFRSSGGSQDNSESMTLLEASFQGTHHSIARMGSSLRSLPGRGGSHGSPIQCTDGRSAWRLVRILAKRGANPSPPIQHDPQYQWRMGLTIGGSTTGCDLPSGPKHIL